MRRTRAATFGAWAGASEAKGTVGRERKGLDEVAKRPWLKRKDQAKSEGKTEKKQKKKKKKKKKKKRKAADEEKAEG